MATNVDIFDYGIQMKSDYNFGDYSKFKANGVIKNDVFLNQNNALSQDLSYDNCVKNNIFTDYRDESQTEDEDEDESDRFIRFLDDMWADENDDPMAYQSDRLFGCVCCPSCQQKSRQFKNKTTQLLNQFRRHLLEVKKSVIKQLSQINQQMNETRLTFAKLLLELQTKLDKKDFQLEKVLDFSQVLQQTNDYLLINNKDLKLRLENVCKQNIVYENKLGIQLKIVLNPNDCSNYLKEIEVQKRLKDSIKDIVVKNNSKDIHKIESNIEDKIKRESESPPKKRPSLSSSPERRSKTSPARLRPLNRSTPTSSPPQKSGPRSKTSAKTSANDMSCVRRTILLNSDMKTYSKKNNHIKDQSNITISRQEIQTKIQKDIGNLFKKYQINNHTNGHTMKKRRLCKSSGDSPPNNHKIDDKPNQQISKNHSPLIDFKKFCENKDRNK